MARQVKPLSATQVDKAKPKEKEYSLADGNGLLLRIKTNGSKAWIFNYTHPISKKRKNLGLGVYPATSLANARKKAHEARQLIADGIDPKTHRDKQLIAKQLEIKNTLEALASEWFEVKKHSITEGYAKDIWRSLELHVFPNLGNTPISEITAPLTINTLRPVERKGSLETVRRVCQRLNEVMTYAVNTGMLHSNPLSGIAHAFKKPKVEHMKTLKPEELPILMKAMSDINMKSITRCAFEFQLHTLTRPNETANAQWSEINWEEKTWVIPEARMKMSRPHIIPLSDACMQILEYMKPISGLKTYIFPSHGDPKKSINSQTVNSVIKKAGFAGKLVSHGMRSIGSTALNEQGFNPDAIEIALSHVDDNKIRAIYNNAIYLDERRVIMRWWSNFILEAASEGHAYTIATKSS